MYISLLLFSLIISFRAYAVRMKTRHPLSLGGFRIFLSLDNHRQRHSRLARAVLGHIPILFHIPSLVMQMTIRQTPPKTRDVQLFR